MTLQNRNGLTDIENKLMVTKKETEQGGINQEYGINRYKLLCLYRYKLLCLLHLKCMSNKDLLCSTRNDIQYLVITYNGK